MAMMGQGLVLMIFGMTMVFLFLWLMIVVVKYSSRLVSRLDRLLPDDSPKPKRRPSTAATVRAASVATATAPSDGTEVKAPVPGSVLRISVTNGQQIRSGDEILVMDVMKMETPISAPCDGVVTVRVAAADKVATGDVVAIVG